tara:strand:+ start:288 stop:575 length:288 start_codon:yes stop_codon:yes gene_type:complete
MYQQHLDLQFPLTQQLGLNLDVPVDQRPQFYVDTGKFTSIDGTYNSVGTISSYFNFNDPDGTVMARMDDTGLSIKMENNSWLKTKVANWLGVKYL